MSRVAIVEDHERLADMVRQALAGVGIEADLFRNLSEASYGVSQIDYAVLIVDRGLADGDGLNFVQTLRATGNMTPCLMLTARDALHDRVDGLESGADDYVTKPFAMSELVARVRTLMRRPATLTSLTASFGSLVIDPQLREMRHGALSASLAPAELQIMLCLIEAGGRTVRHATLETAAWGFSESVTPNALEVALHRLRKKLVGIHADINLVNVRGTGFALQHLRQC